MIAEPWPMVWPVVAKLNVDYLYDLRRKSKQRYNRKTTERKVKAPRGPTFRAGGGSGALSKAIRICDWEEKTGETYDLSRVSPETLTETLKLRWLRKRERELRRAVEPFKVGDTVRDVEGGSEGNVEALSPTYGTVAVRVSASEVLDIDARYLEVCQ